MRLIRLLPWFALALAGCAHDPDRSLHDWLKQGNGTAYEPLDDASARALGDAFSASLSAGPRRAQAWQALAFDQLDSNTQWAVREQAAARRGWGAYVFRASPSRPLLIQAPHADSDLGTGTIALALYRQSSAWALALNSTARTTAAQADQAHAGTGPFMLLTDAALTLDASTVLVQVHGFGSQTARRFDLADDSVVLSNGTTDPDQALRQLAACLVAAGFDARLFPGQARYPGGTGNSVGRRMRERAAGRFVHLELGAALRRQLAQPARLEAFSACL